MRSVYYLESEPIAQLCSGRHWRRIQRQVGSLKVGQKQINLPRQKSDIGQAIVDGTVRQWVDVLDRLARRLGPNALCVVAYQDPLRELFELGARLGVLRYAAAFSDAPSRIFARDYDFIGCAETLLFSTAEVEEAFRSVCVLPYDGVPVHVLADSQPRVPARSSKASRRDARGSDALKVLLVGYYAGPAATVGAKRINYWREMLGEISGGSIRVSVATATKWDAPPTDVHLVADWGPSILVEPDGSVPIWAARFVQQERLNSKFFSIQSYYWRIALEKYFAQRDDKFDVVILTGNPFAVFDFAPYARRRWHARVILDYRDPFANNPRIAYPEEARQRARYIERGYNLAADLVTVVNSDCVPLVEAKEDVPVAVIANGFDEREIGEAEPPLRETDGKIHFVHAGSIFHDRSPNALIAALSPDKHRLHHIGSLAGLEDDRDAPQVVVHGTKEYGDVLRIISSADCGIVFISETGFETPTKLYDYLAHGLDILIITHGRVAHGAIAELLKDRPGVYWAQNTPEGLAEFVSTYRPSVARRSGDEVRRFSRRASAEQLVGWITDLTKPRCDTSAA